MNWTDLNIWVALPELVLLTALFAVLLLDLWTRDENRYITSVLSIVALLLAALAQVAVWQFEPQMAFNNMYIADGLSQFAKLVVYLGTAILFVYSQTYNQNHGIFKGEYYTLALFAVSGMSIMISSSHFLSAYIGLELLSLALYAMIALKRDSKEASEAALKYFVLGAVASGFLLYGISMVYGATGTLEFASIMQAADAKEWLLKLGVLFIVAAVAFKFGAVPFHMWVPDVYQGAPTSVAALIGSVPKIAAVVFAFRILVQTLAPQTVDWMQMFMLLAIASLLLGNFAAIWQTNIKRMLAYSTISHMGFILLSFLGGAVGLEAGIYYALAYVLMSLAGFGVLMLLSRQAYECEQISDLAGLNQKHSWLAFLMLLVMFSMAGIPPLVGFYAKFAVIQTVILAGYVWLGVFAVMMSLIGAFYYLKVVKVMYFDEKQDAEPVNVGVVSLLTLSVHVLLLLVLGLLPDSLMAWIQNVMTYTIH